MTSDLFDIAGKKAVVTGGGSGIGTMSRKMSACPIGIVRDRSTTNGFVMV